MNKDLMNLGKSEEEIEQEVESLCRWAAARAGVINWLLLFIYRQNALNQVIQENKVQEFLSFYGYVNFKNLNQCLN